MTAVARLPWNVYILRCADGTLYTGVARDVQRRVSEHNSVPALGARYTRSRLPVSLVYQESAANRSTACKREFAIKSLSRQEKLALILSAKLGAPVTGPISHKPRAPARRR